MKFDRWKPIRRTTFAYHVFAIHQTEINHLYWAHHAAFNGAYVLTREKKLTDHANSIFPNPKNVRRREITLKQWSRDYNAFDNWSRLAAVIAITGYFEVFMKNIVEAACQSCPAILVGGHREIDGLKLLKTRTIYGFPEESESCTKGTWLARIESYKRIFGSCPQYIRDHASELDKLRNLRNSVGHAFGRTLGPATVGKTLIPEPAIIVKQKPLLDHLALIGDVALEIERHLCERFVGCYEALAAYHFWDGKGMGDKQDARNLRRHIHSKVVTAANLEYFQKLITYYRSV